MKQGTAEWLEWRKNKIGASDAAAIMGMSPWKTPYQLWLEKVGVIENTQNAAMKRGSEMEEQARWVFCDDLSIAVYPSVEVHAKYPWMIASLDGRDAERKIIVEIKCPGAKDHALALKGEIPEKYYAQLQHQMTVCDLNGMWYYSYDGKHGVAVHVDRDEEFIEKMLDAELRFYDCMINFYPPPLCDRDSIKKEDSVWEVTAQEWKTVTEQIRALQEREDELRRRLIWEADGKDCYGAGIRLNRAVRKGNIDYKIVEELKNVNLEPYRKTTAVYWTIRTDKDT